MWTGLSRGGGGSVQLAVHAAYPHHRNDHGVSGGEGGGSVPARVSSKQTKIIFGWNRNKPKQDLFRVCFGLFRETNNKKFRFVSVFRTYIETTETNRPVSQPKQTETTLNFLKNTQIYSLLNCFGGSSVCF